MPDDSRTRIELVRREGSKKQPKTFGFLLIVNGYQVGEMSVSVDQHYPDEIAEQVARTILFRRFSALAEGVRQNCLTDAELKALWARYKPAHYP